MVENHAAATGYDPDQQRNARRLRSRANQIQRAIAAIELAVDGLSHDDRLIALSFVVRGALEAA